MIISRSYWLPAGGGRLTRVSAAHLDDLALGNRHLRLSAESAKQRKDYPRAPESCERCGVGGMLHGHHDDYGKPMDVRWLCVCCHNARHAELRVAAARAAGIIVREHRRRGPGDPHQGCCTLCNSPHHNARMCDQRVAVSA